MTRSHRLYIVVFCLFLFDGTFAQRQWFPAVYDSLTGKYSCDTVWAFPVCFIKVDKGVYTMYGHATHYVTKLTKKEEYYFADHLTLPIRDMSFLQPTFPDSTRIEFARAKYFFYPSKQTAKLIVKTKNRTVTINFLRSPRPFKDINIRFG
jgi:hypothetical protein